MQQGGVLKEPQVDKNGELVLELKATKVLSRDVTAEKPKVKLVDQRIVFKEGDMLTFTDRELQLILITIASFADSLFKAVSHYAKSVKDTNES